MNEEKKIIDPTAPAPMVQQMVAQQQPLNVFQGGNGIMGRFENPIQSQNPTTTENQPVTVGWTPQGQPVQQGSQAQQSWQVMPSPQGQLVSTGLFTGPERLSEAQQGLMPFQKDSTQPDGGFFDWIGGLFKKRPNRHDGETDGEYDERMTRNNERIAVLADAIRHMGNIYNTSKGAPVQRFNNPVAAFEQGLQQRKAERKAKAAAEADAAYKNANLQLKKDAAEADRAYKTMALGYKDRAADRADQQAKDLAEYRKGILGIQQGNLELSAKRFGETQRHNRVTEGQSAARIAISQARAARGGSSGGRAGSGSGSSYTFATPYGRLLSSKAMSAQQQAMAWNEMKRLGMITPKKQAELDSALKGNGTDNPNATMAKGIIDRAIAYGMMDASKKGDALRKFFIDGLGYDEYRESSTPQRGINTTGKRARMVTKTVSKAQAQKIREQRKGANPIRWQGAATKAASQKRQGNQGSTNSNDWSKYIDK